MINKELKRIRNKVHLEVYGVDSEELAKRQALYKKRAAPLKEKLKVAEDNLSTYWSVRKSIEQDLNDIYKQTYGKY